jgi:hypothetical protein
MFQTTQDQINALGGAGAVNFDGSTVFAGTAVQNWVDNAQDTLGYIRDGFDTAVNDLNEAMTGGNPLDAMRVALEGLVGIIGGGFTEDFATYVWDPTAGTDGDFVDAAALGVTATHFFDGTEFVRANPATHVLDPVTNAIRPALASETATHAVALPSAPTNSILADMEHRLDLSLDVLGNVNLESNAMWFQIGPNSMQGMILQL